MAAFRFWRENGIKVLLTIEAGKDESEDANILELCQFIADNKYEKDVVVGFELGNENYAWGTKKLLKIGERWMALIPKIRKVLPKVEGDVEWVALWNGASQLCLVMVNSTSEPASVLLKAKK